MLSVWLRHGSIAAAVLSLSTVHAFGGSPAKDQLLRWVPANAQIVAGIEDPHHGDQSGRLLIVTHNDNADLRDWIALAGVDDGQHVDKLIEAAASSQRGELSEHLLLAHGWFNGRRILAAAHDNGGIDSRYGSTRVVQVKPFARELHEMTDIRWLAVPDDSTIIFGSPAMVKSALDRYASSAVADSALMKRVNDLKPDVNCWSILTMPGPMMVAHVLPGALHEANAALMREVESVSLSVRYGSKERVDFAFGTENAGTATALASAIQGPAHLLPATETLHSQIEALSVHGNEVRGSVRVAGKEFDPWLVRLYARNQAVTSGENVAQVTSER